MHKTDNKKKKKEGEERRGESPEYTHAHTLFTSLQSMLQTNARHTFTTVYLLLFLPFFWF